VRVLFASTQGAGHFGPLVPFVEACVRQGHEVLVVGPPTLDPRGLPFRPGERPSDEELGPLWEAMPQQPPGQSDVVVVGRIFADLNVRAMLPTLRAAIDEWRPDLVVREPNEYASAIAAEDAGVPHVRVAIGLSLAEEGALAIATPALEAARPGITRAIATSAYFTCWPESVDPASFPVARFRAPLAGAAPPAPTGWWPDDARPLVYATLGSVAGSLPAAAAAFPQVLAALGAVPVRALLTTGVELDLGDVPENVHVERWVPQADVLAHAAVVLCHGGAGTTLGALEAGVPLVVVPLFADQPHNAVRVAAVGAGEVSSLAGIRPALERVLSDARYARAAGAVAAEIRRLPPVDEFLAR
jgi:UDP:flavonoid glycosyltransferase YjiC (YdhE family)